MLEVRSTPKPSAKQQRDDKTGKTYRVNEDSFAINQNRNIFAVLDGASGRGGLSGEVASQVVKQVLETIKPHESLEDCVKRANQKLAEVNVEKFSELIPGLIEKGELKVNFQTKFERAKSIQAKLRLIPKEFMSATTIAAVELTKDGKMHWVQAGDAMLAYKQEDGQVKIVTEDRVSKSDYQSYLAQQKAWSKVLKKRGLSLKDFFLSKEQVPKGSRVDLDQMSEFANEEHHKIKRDIEHVIRKGRNRANNRRSFRRYSVIDGTPEAERFLTSGTIDMETEKIQDVAMLTDGYAMPMRRLDKKSILPWQNSFQYLFTHGIDKLFDLVHELESRDPGGLLFPNRLKQNDDRTVISIKKVRQFIMKGPRISYIRNDAYKPPAIASVVHRHQKRQDVKRSREQ